MEQVFKIHAGKFATDAELIEQVIAPLIQPFEHVELAVSHIVTDGEIYTPAHRDEFLVACKDAEVVVVRAKFLVYVNEKGLIRRLVYSDQRLALRFVKEYDPVLEMKLVAKDHYELKYSYESGERYFLVS